MYGWGSCALDRLDGHGYVSEGKTVFFDRCGKGPMYILLGKVVLSGVYWKVLWV